MIVWDEGSSNAGCCGAGGGGHVPLVVVAAGAARSRKSTMPTNHYGPLRTIERVWSLPYLGRSADPANGSIADFLAGP